jgi:hypothetical protein
MSDMSGTRYCVGEFGMSTKFFKNYVALAGPSCQPEGDDSIKPALSGDHPVAEGGRAQGITQSFSRQQGWSILIPQGVV